MGERVTFSNSVRIACKIFSNMFVDGSVMTNTSAILKKKSNAFIKYQRTVVRISDIVFFSSNIRQNCPKTYLKGQG